MKTPEEYAQSLTEHAQQTALFMWAAFGDVREALPGIHRMFAIPNGGKRELINAMNLKAEGMRSGVPDVFLPVPRWGLCGLFMEFKRPKSLGKPAGKLSDKQEAWRDDLRAFGYGVGEVWTYQEARLMVLQWFDRVNLLSTLSR